MNSVSDIQTHPFLGIIGSLGGALLGAVLWVAIYQFGIIASIAGIAIAFCSCKGYILLSKSKKLTGIIIAILIAVLILVATHFFCWGLELYKELRNDYDITLIDAIFAVPSIAFTKDFILDFIKELAIGLILIGVGSAPFVREAIHYRNSQNTTYGG